MAFYSYSYVGAMAGFVAVGFYWIPITYLDFQENSGKLSEGRLSQHLTGLADAR